jgi:hypothetical protein
MLHKAKIAHGIRSMDNVCVSLKSPAVSCLAPWEEARWLQNQAHEKTATTRDQALGRTKATAGKELESRDEWTAGLSLMFISDAILFVSTLPKSDANGEISEYVSPNSTGTGGRCQCPISNSPRRMKRNMPRVAVTMGNGIDHGIVGAAVNLPSGFLLRILTAKWQGHDVVPSTLGR